MVKFQRWQPLAACGRFVLLLVAMLVRPERRAILRQRTLEQAVTVGNNSILVVGLVALFIGAVTCVQLAYNMTSPFIPISIVGYMVRETTIPALALIIICIILATGG